jgi:hypothetical protein
MSIAKRHQPRRRRSASDSAGLGGGNGLLPYERKTKSEPLARCVPPLGVQPRPIVIDRGSRATSRELKRSVRSLARWGSGDEAV